MEVGCDGGAVAVSSDAPKLMANKTPIQNCQQTNQQQERSEGVIPNEAKRMDAPQGVRIWSLVVNLKPLTVSTLWKAIGILCSIFRTETTHLPIALQRFPRRDGGELRCRPSGPFRGAVGGLDGSNFGFTLVITLARTVHLFVGCDAPGLLLLSNYLFPFGIPIDTARQRRGRRKVVSDQELLSWDHCWHDEFLLFILVAVGLVFRFVILLGGRGFRVG